MFDMFRQVVLQDTEDQYRTFQDLLPLLTAPQSMWQHADDWFSADDCNYMVRGYYEFDESFMLEIAGRTLSTRQRRVLEEISEMVRIPLRSCTRQFDNLKSMCKVVEDQPGRISDLLRAIYHLDDDMCRYGLSPAAAGCECPIPPPPFPSIGTSYPHGVDVVPSGSMLRWSLCGTTGSLWTRRT